MQPLLKNVTPSRDYKLELELSNGERRLFDVTPYLDKGIFAQLKDWNYFSRVQAHPRFVSWPQEQDFSLDTLLARSATLAPTTEQPTYRRAPINEVHCAGCSLANNTYGVVRHAYYALRSPNISAISTNSHAKTNSLLRIPQG